MCASLLWNVSFSRFLSSERRRKPWFLCGFAFSVECPRRAGSIGFSAPTESGRRGLPNFTHCHALYVHDFYAITSPRPAGPCLGSQSTTLPVLKQQKGKGEDTTGKRKDTRNRSSKGTLGRSGRGSSHRHVRRSPFAAQRETHARPRPTVRLSSLEAKEEAREVFHPRLSFLGRAQKRSFCFRVSPALLAPRASFLSQEKPARRRFDIHPSAASHKRF
jgi:hypothetical protein